MTKETKYLLLAFGIFIGCLIAINLPDKSPDISKKIEPEWEIELNEPIIVPILASKSQIYAQSAIGLSSINIENRNIDWFTKFSTDKYHITALVASNGILLAQGTSGRVVAISDVTGQILWEHQFEVYHGTEVKLSDAWIEDIEVCHETVYVARYSSSLTAYNLRSGEIAWSIPVPNRTILDVFCEADTAFLVTSTTLYRIDRNTGYVVANTNIGSSIYQVVNTTDELYAARFTKNGIVVSALDLQTLKDKWSTTTLTIAKYSGMIIDNDVLYISGNGLSAVSVHNGKILWEIQTESQLGPPTIALNNIFVQDGKYIYSYNKKSGVVGQIFPVATSIPWTFRSIVKPTVIDDLLIVPSRGPKIYIYRLDI